MQDSPEHTLHDTSHVCITGRITASPSAGYAHEHNGDMVTMQIQHAAPHSCFHVETLPTEHQAGWSTYQQQAPSYSLIVRDTKAQNRNEMYLQPDMLAAYR
jgi:hypothetical protein